MRGPTARSSVTSSSRLAIEVSSTISMSPSSSSTVGPSPGIQPSAEWIVDASRPVDSAIAPRRPAGGGDEHGRRALVAGGRADQPDRRRLAGARAAGDDRQPRGERGLHRLPLRRGRARGRRRRRRPGRRAAASRRGRAGARGRPARPRAPRSAAGRPTARRRRARPRARRRRPSRRAARRPAATPSSSAAAAGASSPTGRHVDPSFSASASTCRTAARARAGESAGTPLARAIRSAVWKPTPNTLVRSYGRRLTTSCARSPYSLTIRGTSQVRPCGASSRCSVRVERSACQDRTASFVRRGLSPSERNARAGSRSISSSTPSP